MGELRLFKKELVLPMFSSEEVNCCKNIQLLYVFYDNKIPDRYSLSPGFWQSFVTIGVHKDHIPALARFCKKQLTGFFVRLFCFS